MKNISPTNKRFYLSFLAFYALCLFFACKKKAIETVPLPRARPVPEVLLKEIVTPHLPSPLYHFEYDSSGNLSAASFASGLVMYNFLYQEARIIEMRNNILINKDRLQYIYNEEGQVTDVNYADSNGVVYTHVYFTYAEGKLVKLVRKKKVANSFSPDKEMTFSYHPDGNVQAIREHHPPFNGQSELYFVNRYDAYDSQLNVDGFTLIHNDFFDHLIVLPGVRFQKNNPGKLIRTGDGTNYKIDYTYTYNNLGIPIKKIGAGTWLSGANAGQSFLSNSNYSYY